MNAKKVLSFIFGFVLLLLVLSFAFLCTSVFLTFPEGSILYPLYDLYDLLSEYLGCFNSSFLSDFSLVPFTLLLFFVFLDLLQKRRFICFVRQVVVFVSFYCLMNLATDTLAIELPAFLSKGSAIVISAIILAAGVFSVVFSCVKKYKAKHVKDKSFIPVKKKKEPKKKRMPSVRESFKILNGLSVPAFKSFDTSSVSTVSEDSTMQMPLEEPFEESVFEQEEDLPEEDLPEEEPFAEEFSGQDFKEEPEESEESEEPEDFAEQEEPAPPVKKVIRVQEIDSISGIGGLESSSDPNRYLIDKQKYKYEFPPSSCLKDYKFEQRTYSSVWDDPVGKIIVDTYKQFGIETELVNIQHGPTFALYELKLAAGIMVNSVLKYASTLGMALASEKPVRVLAPIPGKSLIGIEVPNKERDVIGFKIMNDELQRNPKYRIPFVLGKTITGKVVIADLAKAPHMLIAGATGSGKSVCVNNLICSVLFSKTPKEVRMILVDPKMVELSMYNDIPHLLTPVITDAKRTLQVMNYLIEEMDRRKVLISRAHVRNIEEYNKKIDSGELKAIKFPYIMAVIDEFADIIAEVGKELEMYVKRITAVSRFTGIHLVLATQRPSVDVITGIIKSNIPTRIAFAVSDMTNSKIIIDTPGAEKLLGQGDMLYLSRDGGVERLQGSFIDNDEITSTVEFAKSQGKPDFISEKYFEDDEQKDDFTLKADDDSDSDLFDIAWKIVTEKGAASSSYLQRRLKVGFNRAAELIDELEEAGYIGPATGSSKPREILVPYSSESHRENDEI